MVTTATTRLKRGFVLSPHGNIEYFEVGQGEPLLMLHSTPGSCMAYRNIAPLLAEDCRAIAATTMGYGQSDRPLEPYTTLTEFARAMTWVLDGLGIEKASVYGNSTGSEIAAVLAAEFPERVDKLILEEVFNWGTPSRRAVHERIHRYFEEKPDGSHLVELWNKVGGGRPGADMRRTSERFVNNLIVNSNERAEVYGEMGWEGAGPYAMTRHDIWESAAKIQAPTLVIHGTTSELSRSHERFLATIPHSRGVRLPSTGNFNPPQAPELWAEEVRSFLREPGV
jgi:pimeloyl-ACP methyl ester carboxylesterase